MKRYLGLTRKRYNQMMKLYGNDIEDVKGIISVWGINNCNKGYGVFDYNGLGLFDIESIGDVGAFDDDKAVKLAKRHGVKIIPINELPINMPKDMRFYGWIDTYENRINIAKFCNKLL